MNGVQTYRNPKLVHIFDKLGMIENFGTGIPRTIFSYRDYDIQPEFKITNNFFVVTLPNINFYNELESGRINEQNDADGRINEQNDADGQVNGRINVQNKADGRLNGRINEQNDADGRLNGRINEQNDADGRLNGRINAQNDADGRLNGRINAQNKADGQVNGRINEQNDADGRLNGRINAENDADGQVNGRINEQNDADGRINGQVNDTISDLGRDILIIIMQHPGIRIPEIVIKLSDRGKIVSYSKTRNCVRRNLIDYVERRGSKKSGGYYLKNKF